MSIVPDSRLGKIEFYEAHTKVWLGNAAAIGLTAGACTALDTATVNARDAYNNHLAAQAAAKSATTAFYDAVKTMHSAPGKGADMIQTIKTYAQTTNNPNVYVIAQIPPPSSGGITPPPGTPSDFTVGLLQDGSLELKWKCSNPSGTNGTIYEVLRKVGTGAFVFVGATGVKTFTDDSLPAGASPCTYQVTAIRSTTRGNPAQFTVHFGVGGGGLTVESVEPMKLAA
jgi:hypothetical protein